MSSRSQSAARRWAVLAHTAMAPRLPLLLLLPRWPLPWAGTLPLPPLLLLLRLPM